MDALCQNGDKWQKIQKFEMVWILLSKDKHVKPYL